MAITLTELTQKITHLITEEEKASITKAYLFAQKAHDGQKRYSGEPYFNHVVRACENLISLGVDTKTLVAGLLHDTVEDCGIKPELIEKEFGKEIAGLVTGVSKLGGLKYQGHARYAENLRHLFIATANDIRVILIKLADRLDNTRTLQYVPKEKQKRIALETLEIYASLAHRLGIGKVKSELEDIAFSFAYPEEYKKVEQLIKERGGERERYIKKVYASLVKEFAKLDIQNTSINYRIKDKYSIYKKLLREEMDVAKIYDLYALRVIVSTIEECYKILGIIHSMWKPLPGRIKDYIANPKVNGYQSIHTTVFTGDGGIAEIQVRTKKMHQEAEYGIAAHLIYKEVGVTAKIKNIEERLTWLSKVKELEATHNEPEEFLKHLKFDLFEKQIFAFTPKGDVIELPEGSTALDFAFVIHSEIGEHTAGVKINGKFVSLDTKLTNGNIVEVQTKPGSHPTRKWLDYVETGFARKYIKNYLRAKKLE